MTEDAARLQARATRELGRLHVVRLEVRLEVRL